MCYYHKGVVILVGHAVLDTILIKKYYVWKKCAEEERRLGSAQLRHIQEDSAQKEDNVRIEEQNKGIKKRRKMEKKADEKEG